MSREQTVRVALPVDRQLNELLDDIEAAGRRAKKSEPGERAGGPGEHADPESVARLICLRLLAAAPRTRAQLADALRRRQVPGDAAAAVLARFAEVGLIDDAMFASAWVESRHYGRGLGRRALTAELNRRGVDRSDIDAAVAQLSPETEQATARVLVDRKLASMAGQPQQARIRKLVGMLARKGYPPGLAYRVVREALERGGLGSSTSRTGLEALGFYVCTADLEDGRFGDYWHRYAFGDLGAGAEVRREVMASLVPMLTIAGRCELEGRFLVVRGDLRTYRIHLGSGNILMSPNAQYLCLVTARDTRTSKLFLPFDDDPVLSLILSKAFLLANDTKITDESITRQIGTH